MCATTTVRHIIKQDITRLPWLGYLFHFTLFVKQQGKKNKRKWHFVNAIFAWFHYLRILGKDSFFF